MKFDFYLGSEADFDDWVYDGCKKAFSMLNIKFDSENEQVNINKNIEISVEGD